MINKTLTIGKDYGPIFGLTPAMGTMIYNGGDSWTATKANGQTMTSESAKTTQNALAYINQPSTTMRG